MTKEAIAKLRADLAAAKELRATRLGEFETLQNRAVESEREKDGVENQLRNMRALLRDIVPRTSELKAALEQKRSDVSEASSRLEKRESTLGIAGIPHEKAIKAPKETPYDRSPGVSAADQQYLDMKRREDAGEVPVGTAFKLWRSLKAETDSASSAPSPSRRPNADGAGAGNSTWGQRIVAGRPE